MKASIRFCSVSLALVLACACPLVLAQSAQKQESTKDSVFFIQTSENKKVSGEPGADTFLYVGSEMAFEGGVVKGAPYSAQGTTTFTQVLADGNRISRQTTSQIYRDSDGRTRRAETIAAIGPWASGTEGVQIIHINDPAAGTSFMLNPKDRTASKMTMTVNVMKKGGVAAHAGAVGSGETVTLRVPPPPPGGTMEMKARIPGELFSTMKGQVNKESLGTQEIEGVQAEGTRTTLTIPAGQIGNEQPIQVISERWYSSELQVVVMTRHSDPRTGEEVYKLSNINRTEPAHQLFEIPADYTIKDGGDMMHTFKYDVHTSVEKKHNEQ